ncbi:hypothetical protein BCR34DRAFT_572836 [Clohesyomyces aquaticus]|uniref:Uncharacterized protein n=1 Tax=Clohesyomyces aquaticus TaxID=1231657 RepID=A0A1Y1Z1X2_9PLEO|nr:hypothetical protein BCR34DRAFT_572836 [Clohesyomyces aquaticus]
MPFTYHACGIFHALKIFHVTRDRDFAGCIQCIPSLPFLPSGPTTVVKVDPVPLRGRGTRSSSTRPRQAKRQEQEARNVDLNRSPTPTIRYLHRRRSVAQSAGSSNSSNNTYIHNLLSASKAATPVNHAPDRYFEKPTRPHRAQETRVLPRHVHPQVALPRVIIRVPG